MTPMESRARQYLVDSKGEGGLVCELDRSPMVDEPTLIIGLGGTGIDAMLQAKYVIQRKMLPSDNKAKPDRLAFLAMDTDEKSFSDKRVGDVTIDEIEKLLINEPKLATFMKNPELIPQDYQREWLCRGINADNIKFGAGGIRQCGRFMLINQAQTFIDKVKQTVGQIWGAGKQNGAGFAIDTPIDVYVMTGVGGGTGSGTFLDVAFLLREIITKQMSRAVRMRGFIFMPDVNLCRVKDSATCEYIKANGYAALRELDFWMDSSRGRSFRQQYTSTVTIDTLEQPFDLCFLVSPNGSMPDDYTNCMKTTGEAMMNVLSASEPDPAGNTFGFESYITNLVGMMQAASQNNTYSGNYIYASMGMDEQRLQLDSMANYLAYCLLLKVNGMFDRSPIKEEVEGLFTKTLKLDIKKGLWRLFDKPMPAKPFNSVVRNLDDFSKAIAGYKKKNVLDDGVLEQELKLWETQCKAMYSANLNAILEETQEALKYQIETYFRDLKFGPYYAHRMLHNIQPGELDLIKRLTDEQNALLASMTGLDEQEDNLARMAAEALDSARRNRYVPLVGPGKYKEYVQAIFRLYDHKRYSDFVPIAVNFYTRLINDVKEYNNLIVERFATLLETLTEVFKNNSDIMTNVDKDGTIHTWNVGNFASIRASVDQAMLLLKHQGKEDELVTEFLAFMLEERKAWVGDEGNLGKSFSSFVSDKFHDLMSLNMEETYKQMFNLTSDQQLMSHMNGVVLPRLEAGAKVLYTPDATLSSLDKAPSRAMVNVPNLAQNIFTAVNSYVRAKGLNADVYGSKRVGSLFWFQGSCGLPLYAHDALTVYQTSHDVQGKVDKHLGRYLKMSAAENWEKLIPPLMPETTWKYAHYENPEWSKRFAATRAMLERAWKEELVQPLDGNGVYVLATVDREAYETLIGEAPITTEDRQKLEKGGTTVASTIKCDVGQAKAYVAKIQDFLENGWQPNQTLRFKDDNFNMLMGGAHVVNRTTEQELHDRQILTENILWTPDMATRTAEQLKLKLELKKVLSDIQIFLDSYDNVQKEMYAFADSLTYGLYRMTAPKVFQLDTSGTNLATFTLITIEDYKAAPKDPFYALYLKYMKLTDDQKKTMEVIRKQRQTLMNKEMSTCDARRYNAYCKIVKNVIGPMEQRLEDINMSVDFKYPEIREFYINMIDHLTIFLP